MSKTLAPAFLTLLAEVYPHLKEGEADGVLLAHCAALVRDPNHGPAAGDAQFALRALGLLTPENRGRQVAGAKGASAVRTALVETVVPWKRAGGATKGWGWAAMQAAATEQDGPTFRALMAHPDAPSAEEINQRDFNFLHHDRNSGKPVKTTGSLVAVLLRAINRGTIEEHAVELASAMGEAGVDFNASMRGEHGSPFGHIIFPGQLDALRVGGAQLDLPDDSGLPALARAVRDAHPSQFGNIVGYIQTRCSEDASFAAMTTRLWPAMLEGLAGGLARVRDDHAVKTNYKACKELADHLGLPLGAREGYPSLFALFCRHRLNEGSIGKVDQYLNTRLSDWRAITQGQEVKGKWTGQIEPGIPDGAWGLLLATQNEHFQKGQPFGRERAALYNGGNDQDFWDGVLVLWKRMARNPAVWQATGVLASCFPNANAHLFRRVAMEGMLAVREEDASYSSAQKNMSTIASHVLKSITKEQSPVEPSDIALAVRVQLSLGHGSSLTLHALDYLAKRHPEVLDPDALRKSLAAGREDMPAETLAGVEAALMTIDTPQATARRNGPRL